MAALQMEQLTVGALAENCYIVYDSERNESLVIDPGAEPGQIIWALRHNAVNVSAYLLTHGHADHLGGLFGLIAEIPAPTIMHRADEKWAFTEVNQIPPFYPPHIGGPADLLLLRHDGPLPVPGWPVQVICTPGHTPGGVCYYFPQEGWLFSGDTLFCGSVGRTDLSGGNSKELTNSLNKLKALPPVTQVFPGHGPATTLEEEVKSNYFLRGEG